MQCGPGKFWVILGLNLMGHQVFQVSRRNPVAMLVKIIIKEYSYIMCTVNLRIIPIAMYNLKNALRFNLKACSFKTFLGGACP